MSSSALQSSSHTAPAAPKRRRPLAFDAVLFDIDNVLIDTRFSYRDAIRWTVEIYLTEGTIPMFRLEKKSEKPQLLSADDIDQFKLLGGFNDDWDCCYGLLIYLLSLPARKRTVKHFKQVIDIKGFARKIKRRPLRVNGIVNLLGRPSHVTIERVSRIFQEVYLGKDLFELTERKHPAFWKKRGLIHKEKCIFRKSTLKKLKDMGISLGIATGRPRFEAVNVLKRFGLLDFFDAMITIDEIKKAEEHLKQSLRKPHPYSLVETAKKLGLHKRFLYVGDLPDDMLASKHAQESLQIKSIAFPWLTADSKTIQEVIKTSKPDFVLKKPADIFGIVKGKVTPLAPS